MNANRSFALASAASPLQRLDPQGRLLESDTPVDHQRLLDGYKLMLLTRLFDQKAVALQRTGQLGTYASILGQEAMGVALGQYLHHDDVFIPYYRDLPTQLQRGVQLHELLLYWGGDERGSAFEHCPHDLPLCVPIATQVTHAAGVATAFKVRGEQRVAAVTCGDGATSRGDFFEALNLAGVWQLPMVVLINNNQWAISVPRDLQCAAPSLADKAAAAGLPGVQVDGNDLVALDAVMQTAFERARHGKGATLIESISYRLCDHTTADDANRYRSQDELKQAWEREPIKRVQRYLVAQGLWDETQEQRWVNTCKQRLEQAVETYLNMPPQPPAAMFDYLYDSLPARLETQYAEVQAMATPSKKTSRHKEDAA